MRQANVLRCVAMDFAKQKINRELKSAGSKFQIHGAALYLSERLALVGICQNFVKIHACRDVSSQPAAGSW
jgi:hypothetical protein